MPITGHQRRRCDSVLMFSRRLRQVRDKTMRGKEKREGR